MVVDDSVAMRMIVVRTLKAAGYGGHDIRQAADGQIAFDMIKEKKPDVVLCDWNMPNMTGIELLRALNNARIKTKFGFVTTEGSNELRELAQDNGARFLITKPFTAESFQAELDRYLK